MHFLNMFFFDIYPYIAGSVFLIGSWLRYDYTSTPGAPPPARCWTVRG